MKRIGLVLLFTGVSVLAQQQPGPCESKEAILERYKKLQRDNIVSPQQVDGAQEALANCQAQIPAIRAQEVAALQARLEELRKKYSENHPDVVELERRLEHLRQVLASAGIAPAIAGGNWVPYRNPPANPPSLGGRQAGRPDKWWDNPSLAAMVGLTADEQRKMDDVFRQYRLKLIDLNAALEKEEVTLEPLVAAEPLDESKIAAQIDRVAQARAELEKANGRMLLGIRKTLSQDQWNKLQRGAQ
jgi:Spy/CpxP family protein refolding chaperone